MKLLFSKNSNHYYRNSIEANGKSSVFSCSNNRNSDYYKLQLRGNPWWFSSKNLSASPWVGKIPWTRK